MADRINVYQYWQDTLMSSGSVRVFYNDEAKRIEFPGTGHGERTGRWELRHLEREHSDSPRA